MATYLWAPPQQPDPPDDQPLGVPADPDAVPVDGFPSVWVEVDFTRTGRQQLPGFVERASDAVVFVQLVPMGFGHRLWLPPDRVTRRVLKPRR